MKTVFLLCTFSLVVCLALCSNENEKAEDQGKHSKEILDREKRDAMPQPRGRYNIWCAVEVYARLIKSLKYKSAISR